MNGSEQRNYLIKRSNSIRQLKKINSKKKCYFEIIITKDNRTPPSNKLETEILFLLPRQVVGFMQKAKLLSLYQLKNLEQLRKF